MDEEVEMAGKGVKGSPASDCGMMPPRPMAKALAKITGRCQEPWLSRQAATYHLQNQLTVASARNRYSSASQRKAGAVRVV